MSNSERATVARAIEDCVTFHKMQDESALTVQRYFYVWFFDNGADL